MSAEVMAMVVACMALIVAGTALVMSWMTKREKLKTLRDIK